MLDAIKIVQTEIVDNNKEAMILCDPARKPTCFNGGMRTLKII